MPVVSPHALPLHINFIAVLSPLFRIAIFKTTYNFLLYHTAL